MTLGWIIKLAPTLLNGLHPGLLAFRDLPDNYVCPLRDAPQHEYRLLQTNVIEVPV